MYLTKIAIVGAGGQIGRRIVEALLEQGKHTLTAITRDTSDSTIQQGVSIRQVPSYESHEELVQALQDQDVLIVSLNPRHAASYQINLIDAAIEAGVRYIIPNEYGGDREKLDLGVDTRLGPQQLKIREYIEANGKGRTNWIAISCGFWYESSLAAGLECFGFDITNRRVTFFDDGNTKVTTSTRRQVARAVAKLLALPLTSPGDSSPCLSDWNNRALYVGDFSISQREMFQSLLSITDTTDNDWTVTYESSHERCREASEKLKSGDFSAFVTLLYSRTFFPNDPGEFHSKLQNGLLGLPAANLDDATREAVNIAAEGAEA